MIRRFLSLLLFVAPVCCFAQKPDYVRTPNGPNTIIDWNLKAKTFVAPHGNTLTLAGSQDTTGQIRVLYDGTNYGFYYYIHPNSGSGFWVQAGATSTPTSEQITFTSVTGKTINWQTDIPPGATQTYAQIFGNNPNPTVWFLSGSSYTTAGNYPVINYSGGNISTMVFDWGSSQSGYIRF